MSQTYLFMCLGISLGSSAPVSKRISVAATASCRRISPGRSPMRSLWRIAQRRSG